MDPKNNKYLIDLLADIRLAVVKFQESQVTVTKNIENLVMQKGGILGLLAQRMQQLREYEAKLTNRRVKRDKDGEERYARFF